MSPKRITFDPPIWENDTNHRDPDVITTGGKQELKDKQHRHWLVITNNEEDVGQDGYQEDLEWEIIHSPDCPYEVIRYYDFGGGVHTHYQCRVGLEVEHNGIDGLELTTGTGEGWQELEPGRYEIEAWSEYSPPTPMGGGEWDGGLRFV